MARPEVRLAAVCDHAVMGQDGKATLVGVFRTISVTSLPAEHPRLYLVVIFGLDAGTHRVVVRLRLPDGSQGIENAPELTVQGAADADSNVIVEFNKLVLNATGLHHFDIEVDGGPAASVEFAVSQLVTAPGGSRPN
ncbi:MAG: hypothetical protein FJ034_03880 [Chloroflexi bacterium]|nr:hypothetical protein [Chloroflexota bacterium]